MDRSLRGAAIGLLLLTATSATAGTIHPGLQQEMDKSAPGTMFSVIVNLREQAPIATMNAQMREGFTPRSERHRRVVEALQATARDSQQSLKQELDLAIVSGDVTGYTSYWISNIIVMQATKETVARIAARNDVDVVESNFKASLIEPIGNAPTGELRGIGVTPGLRAIRAPEVWHEFGFTGAGTLIGSLDTGVDGNHPALSTRWRGYNGQEPWQECWIDQLGGNTQFPSDGYGHGTHTTGTMCGLGAATNDTVGVAWGAKWIASNAINQGVGGAFDNDILVAFQWFTDPDGNPNTVDDVPDVVQNSWGIAEWFGQGYTDCDSRWWNVIDNCEAAGVVTCWSAGNEGPGGTSLRSPADRATTLTNCFSVGAVDATNYNWPYPIASFSSRGPTGCNVPNDRKIKPEVSAPGVDVYSSVPGGGYSQAWSGTSMAGPHVAGTVALMREANPNLDVDTIKQILMETARDEGTAGEDNNYGWGFIDAYEAILRSITGYGRLEGHVSNASHNNDAIASARVTLLDIGTDFTTDATGFYTGLAPEATYQVEAYHPDFRADTVQVTLISNQVVTQDFHLIDDKGPRFTNVTDLGSTSNTVGPYPVRVTLADPSGVAGCKLHYRVNQGAWYEVTMTGGLGGVYNANLPGRPSGSWIDYYFVATDGGEGATSASPANAPASFYTLYITDVFFADNAETNQGWALSGAGDNATTGLWVREDPVGTTYQQLVVQPEDDNTPNPGVICFVTGNANPGQPATTNDVDNGCTSLISPTFALANADRAFVVYHRWFAQAQNVDDEFQIDVSNNGGSTWVPLERIVDDRAWKRVSIELNDFIGLTNNMKLRFRACDQGVGGIVEAAIDDITVETFVAAPADAPAPIVSLPDALAQNEPNPASATTSIRFTLSNPAQARLEIFDASGRLVRVLLDQALTSGVHQIAWDGRDDSGRDVGAGVYFYRLKAGAFEQSKRMTVLR